MMRRLAQTTWMTCALVLLGALVVSGCSQSVSQKTPHESARVTDAPALEAERSETVRGLSPEAEPTQSGLSRMSTDDLYTKNLAPILDEVLDPAKIRNQRTATDPKMKEMLRVLNSSLIALSAKSDPRVNEVLDRYEAAVLDGCDQSLKGCKNVGFFTNDPESATVAHLLAKREKSLKRHYALLLLGFDLGKSQRQPRLQELYLERLSEWLMLLSEENDRELLNKHQRVLSLILTQKKEELRSIDGMPKWLGALDPFSLSRIKTTAISANMTTLLELTARVGVYDSSGKPNESLKNSIARMQAEPQSFSSEEAKLPKSLVEGLKATAIGEKDEYFLLIDRLYLGHFNQADALALWVSTRQDRARVAHVIKSYVQSRMAALIEASNSHMSGLFSDKDKSANIMKSAVKRSNELTESWMMFQHSAALLKEFADRTLRLDNPKDSLHDDLTRFFDGLKTSIKLSVTYPHMMMMAFHLSRIKFQETIQTLFGPVQIDSTLVMNQLFSGTTSPWFQYGTDKKPLNPTELLYAFEFAVKADVFRAFGIDGEEFLVSVFDRVIGPKLGRIKAEYLHLKQKYEETTEWSTILNLCSALQNEKPYMNHVRLDEVSTSVFLGGRFKRLLYNSDGTEKNADGTPKRGYFMYGTKLLDAVEFIRLDLDPNLAYFGFMVEAVERSTKKATASLGTKALSEPRQRIQNAHAARDRYLNLVLSRHREFSSCFFTLFAKEREVELGILKAEAEYLRQIYREMKALASAPQETEARNERHRFSGLPGGFKGFSSFDQNTYNHSHLDMLVRMKMYIEKGLRTETVTLQPIDSQMSLEVPGNLKETYLFTGNRLTQIDRTDSENEFVVAGLKAMLDRSRDGDKLLWFVSDRFTAYQLRNWVHALAILHRLTPTSSSGNASPAPIVATTEMIETPFRLMDFLNIKADVSWMKATNTETRVINDTVYDLFIHRHTREPLPPHNLAYTYLVLDVLGSTANDGSFAYKDLTVELSPRPKNFLPVREMAIDFTRYLSSRPAMTFDMDKDLDERLLAYHGNRVKQDLGKVMAFEKASEKKLQDDRTQGIKRIHHLNAGSLHVYDEYLAPVLRSNFRTTVENFNVSSYGRFK